MESVGNGRDGGTLFVFGEPQFIIATDSGFGDSERAGDMEFKWPFVAVTVDAILILLL